MKSCRFTVRCILLTLVFLSVTAATASAQTGARQKAERLFVDGNAAYRRGDYDSASKITRRLSVLSPNIPQLYFARGTAYLTQSKADLAIKYHFVNLKFEDCQFLDVSKYLYCEE